MGARGPKPKPNADRLDVHADRSLDVPATTPTIDAPPADESWHPRAMVWYLSLARTPQAGEYTRSDWGDAWAAAGDYSDLLHLGSVGKAAEVRAEAARALMATRPARLAARLDIDSGADVDDALILELPTNEQLIRRAWGT